MNSQRNDTSELVQRIRQGYTPGWRQLVEQYEPLLSWSARQYRLSPDDIADAVQVTWLRCLEHLDQLTDDDKFGAWITTICRRECLSLATRRRREIIMAEVQESLPSGGSAGWSAVWSAGRAEGGDPCGEAVRRDEQERLRQAIARLPYRQRVVVQELMEREGESYAEASRRLGMPIGSIGPTRQRALARLRNDPELNDAPYRLNAIESRELETA
jgi:RNA polymerase sigma factor (sigma-70 family)